VPKNAYQDWEAPWVQVLGSPKHKLDKMDHLMAEKNKNNKDSQKGKSRQKKILKKYNSKQIRFRKFLGQSNLKTF
jgi:hypothetical protein